MRPAVLTGITPEMDAYSEEIFGPVAMVYGADSEEDAVQLANDVSFGLERLGLGFGPRAGPGGCRPAGGRDGLRQ